MASILVIHNNPLYLCSILLKFGFQGLNLMTDVVFSWCFLYIFYSQNNLSRLLNFLVCFMRIFSFLKLLYGVLGFLFT